MQPSILSTTVIVFGLSVVVLLLCYRLKIPTIVGFLLTGVLCGPSVFGLVSATHEVETLAEIGVVLLLFSIGIEFSLKNLVQIRRIVLLGGSLQVVFTIAVVTFIAWRLGWALNKSVFLGFLLSLSSTAIVLKWFQERSEVESPHGKTGLGILIYQDLIVVPMMLVLPLLSGQSTAIGTTIGILLLKIAAIIATMFIMLKWVVPIVLYRIAATRSRELFLLAIIVICFSIAWLTSSAGLSLALGAFLAGLILSESEYSNQALGSITPFRDVFTSVFFISIGMLFDVHYFLRHPIMVLVCASGVLIIKILVASTVPFLLGFPLRTMVLCGFALGQVGEFSFILSTAGMAVGLLDQETYQLFLGVSIITMAATPFIMARSPQFADFLLSLPLPEKLKTGMKPDVVVPASIDHTASDHVIIVGYGINGQNVARAAKVAGIPYVVTEMNPETVQRERALGEPVFYGDATQESVLMHVNVRQARVIVVGIPDAVATQRVIEVARALNPAVYIIARTRFFHETELLYKLGASEVIPEEFETSVEIFTRVLIKYLVPRETIERFIAEIRSDSYKMFRNSSSQNQSFSDLRFALPELEVSMAWVSDGSPLSGKSLAEINLRPRYGITLLAIRRGSEVVSNPESSVKLTEGDILVVLGKPKDIVVFTEALRNHFS